LSYNDASVQAGVTYYYVVTAFDDRAQKSVYSAEARAVVP
jgi:fibronectin type 3 domain-containing protein